MIIQEHLELTEKPPGDLQLHQLQARRRHLERRSFQTRAQLWEEIENSQDTTIATEHLELWNVWLFGSVLLFLV